MTLNDDENEEEYSFCCLGLACEVAIENGVPFKIESSGVFGCIKYDNEDCNLPPKVEKLFKFHGPLGAFDALIYNYVKRAQFQQDVDKLFVVSYELADFNDNGVSFKRIAKFVRKYPEAIFSETA